MAFSLAQGRAHSDGSVDFDSLSPKGFEYYEQYFPVAWIECMVSRPDPFPKTGRGLPQGAPSPYPNRRRLRRRFQRRLEIILSRTRCHIFRTLSRMAVCTSLPRSLGELQGLLRPCDHYVIYRGPDRTMGKGPPRTSRGKSTRSVYLLVSDENSFFRLPVGLSRLSTTVQTSIAKHHSTTPRSSLCVALTSCCPARELRGRRSPDEPIA